MFSKEKGNQCELQKALFSGKVSNTSWFAEVLPNLDLWPWSPSVLENTHVLPSCMYYPLWRQRLHGLKQKLNVLQFLWRNTEIMFYNFVNSFGHVDNEFISLGWYWTVCLSLNTFSTTIIIIGYLLCDLSHNSVVFSMLRTFIVISRYMVLSGTYEVNDWMTSYCLLWQVSEGRHWLWIPRCMSLNKIKMVADFTALLPSAFLSFGPWHKDKSSQFSL